MSVLTVPGLASIPDRTLQNDYARTSSFTRKPVSTSQGIQAAGPGTGLGNTRHIAGLPQSQPMTQQSPTNISTHRHSRTISSALLPNEFYDSRPANTPPSRSSPRSPYPPSQASYHHSRQSSTSTMDAVTVQMHQMHRQTTSASGSSISPSMNAPRRSTSSRSSATNAPTSYVALMRKQKATVWCDRSQNMDPRIAAAQRAAKQRAAIEVNSIASSGGRTSTISSGGVVGKIRHGGVPKAPGYAGGNMSGAGVPMRLSANEMLGDDEESSGSFRTGDNQMMHARTGSGKSSTSSLKYRSGYPRQESSKYLGATGQTYKTTPSPPSGEGNSPSNEGIPELSEQQSNSQQHQTMKRTDSEDPFGEVGEMQAPSKLQNAMQDAKKADDLRRRGSVDERAMSMGAGVRLFVANPDLDD